MEGLNRKRGAIKGRLTRWSTEIGALVIAQTDVTVFEEYLASIEDAYSDYKKIKQSILNEIDLLEREKSKSSDEISAIFDEQDLKFGEIEKQFMMIRSEIKRRLREYRTIPDPLVNPPPPPPLYDVKANLPKLTLPQFSGKYEEFVAFKEKFFALVHNSPCIPTIQKYQMLLDCLSDKVKKAYENLEFNEESYLILLEKLQKRYSNKKITVDKHISGLVNMRAMSKESSGELNRVIEETSIHVSALKSLGIPIESWDAIVVYLISVKLEPETRKRWEETVDKDKVPVWEEMQVFLQKRCTALESVEIAVDFKKKTPVQPSSSKEIKQYKSLVVGNGPLICLNCAGSHELISCREFVAWPLTLKFKFVKEHKMCFNCLSPDHVSKKCPVEMQCTKCPARVKVKHHLLLHIGQKQEQDSPEGKVEDKTVQMEKPKTSLNCRMDPMAEQNVILMTAMVFMYGRDDQPHLARILVDPGSEISFVTKNFAEKLKLPLNQCKLSVVGIQGAKSQCAGKVKVYVRSRHRDFGKSLDFYVIDQITKNIPSHSFSVKGWKIPSNYVLADPEFNQAGNVDALVGAEMFVELLLRGRVKLNKNLPYLVETLLGWIWSGTFVQRIEPKEEKEKLCHLVSKDELSRQVEKFWTMESPAAFEDYTLEEDLCAKQFLENAKRGPDGRYEVPLLVNDEAPALGETRNIAVSRLNSLVKRLESNPEMHKLYCDFMDEYLELGHMREVDGTGTTELGVYYMPHHGVYKPDSKTTPLRVVFNASQKSSNGVSLNDRLMNAGHIQPDLVKVMLGHRLYEFVFSADIIKMFRQIRMLEIYRSLLRILWRKSMKDPIKEFELWTVTYGTKSAACLATMVLILHAHMRKDKYLLAYLIIMYRTLMDDACAGFDTLEEALQAQGELIELLGEIGMKLHKWCANHPDLLKNVDADKTGNFSFEEDKEDQTVKTLGILWKPKEDVYKFVVSYQVNEDAVTKRIVLSEIARIFDPLGLISPVIVRAKIFLRDIWCMKYDWDDPLSDELQEQWQKFRSDLKLIEGLEIPRFINPLKAKRFELLGFGDASKDAYGVCVYMRATDENGKTSCRLLYSKSRVASLHHTSIPRLELEAALLLMQCVDYLVPGIDFQLERILLFSDSRVVLAWLKTEILKLKIYVANRIRKIKELCESQKIFYKWYYVPTKLNPADLVSRGVSARRLIERIDWWNAPDLKELESEEEFEFAEEERDAFDLELRNQTEEVASMVAVNDSTRFSMFIDISGFQTLLRVVAFMRRFVSNCKKKRAGEPTLIQALTTKELDEARETVVRCAQLDAMENEMKLIASGRLSNKHALKPLNPVLINGTIRVGGRLTDTKFNWDKKHPMLLPNDHALTKMIIEDLHKRYLHVGPQGLLAIIREKYWITNGKSVIRKILHSCIVCFKVNPRDVETFMGNLPSYRVEPSFPFFRTGVDYGGPITIKLGGPRSKQSAKAWLVIFVCMVTKALHLELVTSLSSEAFRAVLQRFIGRRGKPQEMHSDNGTNFIGCRNELKELHELFNKENQKHIAEYCLEEGIAWFTIPPRASHFGGQWEAGVKSVKYHYKRIVGDAFLTYEETLTLLIEIEGILNSRPLYAMSSDPNDFAPLTPAHFLIGRPMTTFPQPDLTMTAANRLTRYERVTQMRQHFWKKFSLEYVTSLQARSKWFKKPPEIKLNQLVLLKDENLPSFKWRTGRIIKLHPGKDNVVRVVVVKTDTGQEFKRDTQKICILPLETDVEETEVVDSL